jgi:release factor glutamine methyltransferase
VRTREKSLTTLDLRLLREHAAGDEALLDQLIQRRLAHEPVSQIIGSRGFWEHEFIVSRDVLTPRPDSEVLIEEALKCLPDRELPYRFLDLGTGSGCLILSLLHEFPQSKGLAVDASPKALEIAKRNAQQLKMEDRIMFQQGDWAKGLTGAFDLVISNPPYIPAKQKVDLMPEVRDYEPEMALIGGEDGLECYRILSAQTPALLKSGGWLIFEVGIHQAGTVAAMGPQNGLKCHKIRKDYGGIERAVIFTKE